MLNLTPSQCIEIKRRLKPISRVDMEGMFDRHLNSYFASPIKMFGKTYYSAEVFKCFDRATYEKELDYYFEGNGLYIKVCILASCKYYRASSIRKLLNLSYEELPINWSFNWGGKGDSVEQVYEESLKEREEVYKRLAES